MPGHERDSHRYLLLHKPYQILTTFTDPEGRATLADYVPVSDVYAAGRLDRDSEGLLLLTNDGQMAHRLTHPRHKLPKTYLVQVENIPTDDALNALRSGVVIRDHLTAPAQVDLLAQAPTVAPRSVPIRQRKSIPTCWLRIVLREGRKRQIRHMTAAVGTPTLRLIRVGIGPLTLEGLQPGQWRDLSPTELDGLRRAIRSAGR